MSTRDAAASRSASSSRCSAPSHRTSRSTPRSAASSWSASRNPSSPGAGSPATTSSGAQPRSACSSASAATASSWPLSGRDAAGHRHDRAVRLELERAPHLGRDLRPRGREQLEVDAGRHDPGAVGPGTDTVDEHGGLGARTRDHRVCLAGEVVLARRRWRWSWRSAAPSWPVFITDRVWKLCTNGIPSSSRGRQRREPAEPVVRVHDSTGAGGPAPRNPRRTRRSPCAGRPSAARRGRPRRARAASRPAAARERPARPRRAYQIDLHVAHRELGRQARAWHIRAARVAGAGLRDRRRCASTRAPPADRERAMLPLYCGDMG